MTRFLHLANWHSANIGNGALIYGTERVIREDCGEVSFAPLAWDDYTFERKAFDADFVAMVNRHDALLVNGAVTFNGRSYLKNAGMRFDLPFPLWPSIEKPIIFYGVSYRVWPGDEYHHRDKLQKTFRYLLERPDVLCGVRNDGTKEWLAATVGIVSDRIISIPDPAVFVPHEKAAHRELENGRPNVIVGLNNEDGAQRFGGGEVKRRVVAAVAHTLDRLIDERQANIILCPHYFDDYGMLADLIGAMKPANAHQHVVSTGLLAASHAPYFYDLYAQADLALSMRIHSMSPSIGLGTPVVPIISQARMRDFLADVGLSDIAVDIADENIAATLAARVAAALDNPAALTARLRASARAMRERLRAFNGKVADLTAR